MKIRNGKGEWNLRKLLHRCVGKGLLERPGMDLVVPIHGRLG